MWKWKAKKGISLINCANFGASVSDCKFSVKSEDNDINNTVIFNACALIPCSKLAVDSILSVGN